MKEVIHTLLWNATGLPWKSVGGKYLKNDMEVLKRAINAIFDAEE